MVVTGTPTKAGPQATRTAAGAGTGRLWRWRRWLFGAALLCCAGLGTGLFMLSRLHLPPPRPLEQTTFVYDSSGKQVLAAFSQQNRVNVKLDQVPQVVIDAVVSTEDRHFWTEGALNLVSIVRALVTDLGGGNLQGGSTITQQYVKQAYLTPKRTLVRKIEEAALAVRLSHAESKRQILQNYLNAIYWGRGAYGIEAASEAYFGKPVEQLSLREGSLLAALIREPELADPARDPVLARRNQDDTLNAMVRDHKITRAQAGQVRDTPFSAYVISPTATSGAAPLGGSTGTLGDEYFISAVRQQLYSAYGRAAVDGGGLRVTTTLDPVMQARAYRSLYGGGPYALDPARGDPSAALVSLDDNGDVRALVGGQDFARSTVNLALGAAGGGGGRQAGSTFKAIMLAEVLKEGYSLASVLPAPPEVVVPHGNANGTPWVVKNFEGETPAPSLGLIDATAYSINTVFAQVVERVGAANLDSMAIDLGISPSEVAGAYPSQVLGTAQVSPLEMAAAYATFASGGVYHRPLLVTRVTTANGTPLPLPVEPRSRVVLSPSQAAQLDYVLEQVVLRGTGTVAGGIGSEVAGKTGTTEHSSDAWFVGYTPALTSAIWMGYANSTRPMVHFRGLASVQGGTLPARMWHYYMAGVVSAMPGYAGSFPPVRYLAGKVLAPPPASSLEFPLGTGASAPTSSTTTGTPAGTGTPSPAGTGAPSPAGTASTTGTPAGSPSTTTGTPAGTGGPASSPSPGRTPTSSSPPTSSSSPTTTPATTPTPKTSPPVTSP